MHGAHAPQQARQLVLADILQPLVESIAQHLVHTQESGKERRVQGQSHTLRGHRARTGGTPTLSTVAPQPSVKDVCAHFMEWKLRHQKCGQGHTTGQECSKGKTGNPEERLGMLEGMEGSPVSATKPLQLQLRAVKLG